MAMKFLQRSLRGQQRNRFDLYDPTVDANRPEITGTINNDNDFDLGTPSLTRKENISLIASNSSGNQALVLRLAWRPANGTQVVCLSTKFELYVEGEHYEFNQLIAYEPKESTVKPGRILQYGGPQSSLKIHIPAPYRRMRISFHGHMHQRTSSKGVAKFFRVNMIVSPTTGIFDFLREFDVKCQPIKIKKNLVDAVHELVLHDRHEQIISIQGEYTMIGDATESSSKGNLYLWGFYNRHFVGEKTQRIMIRQVLGHCVNGRAFHLAQASYRDNSTESVPPVIFGYTCFSAGADTDPIQKPFELDWDKISDETEELKLLVRGQEKKFNCVMCRRDKGLAQFYNLDMEGKAGWAWASMDETLETETERQALEQCLTRYLLFRDERRIVSPVELKQEFFNEKPHVLSIEDDSCRSSELVGAKAASLAQLRLFSSKTETKPIVPSALVLTCFAQDLLLDENANLKEEIIQLTRFAGEEGQLNGLQQKCEKLQEQVREASFPFDLREKLVAKLDELFDANWAETREFAVRSSSWGEDEEDMSAAGQLSTLLNVRGLDDLLSAVLTCFASKFSLENIEYKRQHGLPLDLPMAVVVQEMVQCEKAGVLFTCDPKTGDDSVYIMTANYGLGESVVSGQADPDTILVRLGSANDEKTFTIEQVNVGEKKVVIGDIEIQDRSSKCCLRDDEILGLASCGQAVSAYFCSARDIEWGFKGDEIYLFQSRPVTGIDAYTEFELIHEADQPSRAEHEFCSRANVGEVMPFALTPLTFSFVIKPWILFGSRLEMIFRGPQRRKYSPECPPGNLFNSYHLFFTLKGRSLFSARDSEGNKPSTTKFMELGFFGHELEGENFEDLLEAAKDVGQPALTPLQMQLFKLLTLNFRMNPLKKVRREKKTMRRARENLHSLRFATGYDENKMLGLYNQLKNNIECIFVGWKNHGLSILINSEYSASLLELLSKYIKDKVQLFAAVSKFLSLSSDVVSAEVPQRIGKMSQLIKANGEEEIKQFLAMSPKEALVYLREGTNNEQLKQEFLNFMEKFGYRCYNEFEIASITWSEAPEQVVEMIKTNCKHEKSLKTNDQQPQQIENIRGDRDSSCDKRPIDDMIDSLGIKLSELDYLKLKYSLIPKCRALVATREQTKDILIEHVDILRKATRLLARELCRNLRIPDDNLIYYFLFDELEPLVRAPQPGLVIHAIRRRNMFKKVFKEAWKFDEIIRGYEFKPKHLRSSEELDKAIAEAPKLYGTPASSGRVQGKVCLINVFSELDRVKAGNILVTHSTDIAFSPIFPLISGIITEVGGLISHGAVVAREYGLPSVLGVPNVTRILQDDEEIILDADNGTIIRMSKVNSLPIDGDVRAKG